MNKHALDMLTKARANMIIDQPFFATLALRLKFVERTDIPTLAVDGKHIFYNPDYILSIGLELTKSAIAHEVMHPAFDHLSRIGERNPRKWNMAGDYVINPILKDAGFRLGNGWLYDPTYLGMSADHVYTLIPDSPGGESGEWAPDGEGEGLDQMLPGSADPDEAEAERMEWKMAAVQAAQIAKEQGKLPGSLERFVDQIAGNTVDWRAHLRRFVTEVSKNDYSWQRPNRKYMALGLYLPTLYSEAMGEMVVCVDTSGSVDQPTLAAFAAEISALRDAVLPERVYVIYCDAHVNRVDVFERDDPFEIAAVGGGGTDFRPPFEWIKEHGVRPACAIYLTDMYGSFPEQPAPFPMLWCATSDVIAPWGETVKMEI